MAIVFILAVDAVAAAAAANAPRRELVQTFSGGTEGRKEGGAALPRSVSPSLSHCLKALSVSVPFAPACESLPARLGDKECRGIQASCPCLIEKCVAERERQSPMTIPLCPRLRSLLSVEEARLCDDMRARPPVGCPRQTPLLELRPS